MLTSFYNYFYQTSIVWKLALGSAFSWEIARLLGSSHPYLAPLSVILCLQVTVGASIRYGLQRVLGTLAGVVFAAFLVPYIGMNAWSLGLMLLVGSFIVKWMGFNKIVINQVALSILLVLTFESHSSYGIDRIRDTFVGCVVAVVINMLLIPPDFTEKAVQEAETYTEGLAKNFNRLQKWLEKGIDVGEAELQANSEGLLKDLTKTMDQFEQAEQSIRYHPFTKKHRRLLSLYKKQIAFLYQGSANLNNMVQTLSEWMKNEEMVSEERHFWAERMNTIEIFLKEWKRGMDQSQANVNLSSDVIKEMKKWSSNLQLPNSKNAYRFAFALQNDTLNMLHVFEKGAREFLADADKN